MQNLSKSTRKKNYICIDLCSSDSSTSSEKQDDNYKYNQGNHDVYTDSPDNSFGILRVMFPEVEPSLLSEYFFKNNGHFDNTVEDIKEKLAAAQLVVNFHNSHQRNTHTIDL